ncbi:MAG: PBS lyase HEAT-like repeat protein [Spirochaetes bacterium ADurb.BinA120]|nr:MAG: PBS lyase HEAT-like repeat protein [Spirochaetes bacterium ADurb.BinA120]HPV98040.1 HEAT repeat domain-containing protein [Spirochaetota bacterium]
MLCAIILAALPILTSAAQAGGSTIELLRSGSYEQRLDAMLKAGFSGNKEAFYYLIGHLSGEKEGVLSERWRTRLRAAAAESLGRLRDERALPHLVARYGREESLEVRRSILFAISFFRSEGTSEVIRDGLASSDEGVRFEAIRTAALSGGPVHVPALRELAAKAEAERVRLAAAWALAMLEDEPGKNVALLEEGLKSRDPESRFWSSVYLGEAGMRGSLEAVARAREIENMEWVKREMDTAVARLAVMRKKMKERAEDERLGRATGLRPAGGPPEERPGGPEK